MRSNVMCVCVCFWLYVSVFSSAHSSLSSLSMQKWKATTIQLASTASIAKSILPCGQATEKPNAIERDTRAKIGRKKMNTRFHSTIWSFDDDPFANVHTQHRCYCSVRWFLVKHITSRDKQ